MAVRSMFTSTVRQYLAVVVLGFGALALPRTAHAEITLLMVEEVGCIWCARWHADVGPEYPITPEGLAAPLRTILIGDPQLDALTLTSTPVYTPTFLLLDGTREIGRIEGYPGEEFFWGFLGRLLDRAEPGWSQ